MGIYPGNARTITRKIYYHEPAPAIARKRRLAGSIYTQPFDVEGEENGIMTYDREVTKMPFEELRKMHANIIPNIGTVPQVTAQNADITDPEYSVQ